MSVVWGQFFVNLTHTRVSWEEGSSVEELAPSEGIVGLSLGAFPWVLTERAQFTVGNATTTHDILDCIRKLIKPWRASQWAPFLYGLCFSAFFRVLLEVLPWGLLGLPFVMHCYILEAKISLFSRRYFWSAYVMVAEKLLEQVMYTFGLLWISLQWILTK